MFALCQALDPATRLSGTSIIHYLTPYLAAADKDDFPNLLIIYQQCLKEHDHPLIQVEACRSVCTLLRNLQTYETIQFVNLIPLILRALEKKDTMVLFIKCLQFSDNEIKRSVNVNCSCHS